MATCAPPSVVGKYLNAHTGISETAAKANNIPVAACGWRATHGEGDVSNGVDPGEAIVMGYRLIRRRVHAKIDVSFWVLRTSLLVEEVAARVIGTLLKLTAGAAVAELTATTAG